MENNAGDHPHNAPPLIDFVGPTPGEVPEPRRLGPRRRQMALIVILMGLATFVTPLISTDSPVLGRTQWSPLEIAEGLSTGKLPIVRYATSNPAYRRVELTLALSLGFGSIYLFLIGIAAAILFFPSPKFVGYSAGSAAAFILGELQFYDSSSLQMTLYGVPSVSSSDGRTHIGVFYMTLLTLCGLLALIAAWKELD